MVLVRNGELTVVGSVSASEQSRFKDGSDDEVDLQRCLMITSSVRQESWYPLVAGCWFAIEVIEMIAEGALSMYILDSLILARQKLGTPAVGWGIVPSSTHCRRQHDE